MQSRSELIASYLEDQKKAVGESARANRFSILLGALFSDRPDLISDYINGIEKWVSKWILALRHGSPVHDSVSQEVNRFAAMSKDCFLSGD